VDEYRGGFLLIKGKEIIEKALSACLNQPVESIVLFCVERDPESYHRSIFQYFSLYASTILTQSSGTYNTLNGFYSNNL